MQLPIEDVFFKYSIYIEGNPGPLRWPFFYDFQLKKLATIADLVPHPKTEDDTAAVIEQIREMRKGITLGDNDLKELIKARGDTPRFALSMLTKNVKSVRIRLDKE